MRKTTVDILLRLDEREAAYLDRLVKQSGRTRSSFLRAVIMNYRLCEKPDPEFYHAMRELSRFGNNLNQLTAKAHSLGCIDAPALKMEMQQWQRFRTDIYTTFLEPKRIQSNGSL